MKIFHVLPKNLTPSGGIKVHYQLAQLEMDLGYPSAIVYEDWNGELPGWFKHGVREMSYHQMLKEANLVDDLIVGWEDIEPLLRSGFRKKVSYIQGEVFVNRSNPYHGVGIWISSNWNMTALKPLPQFFRRGLCYVPPFIDDGVFFFDKDVEKKDVVMVQARKAGDDAVQNLANAGCEAKFKILPSISEKSFADELRQSKYFLAHSFPEGFGLPPLEAMSCGCQVAGFTGGGGIDFMIDGRNCFVAADGDYRALALKINRMLENQPNDHMVLMGLETAAAYSKEKTKEHLATALEICEDRFDILL